MVWNLDRYTRRYSIEVVIRHNLKVEFRVVDTGIGWVALATGDTPEHAMQIAKNKEPLCDFVRHRDAVNVHLPNGGSLHDGLLGRDAASREEQYATALMYVDSYYHNPDLLNDVERAIRLAFPAEPFLAIA